MVFRSLLGFSLLLLSTPSLAEMAPVIFWDQEARVCPAGAADLPPRFDRAECSSTPFVEIDPQDRELWVEARIEVERSTISDDTPLGLFVTGKASSEIWFNGSYIGSNGQPGRNAEVELPGQMDAVFFLPTELVRDGENIVVLRLSSMGGYLHLSNPMHFLAIAPYESPRQAMIAVYWPALVTFGIFLIGAVYFAITAVRGYDTTGSGIVALSSLFAALQLFSETARGLFAYSYPIHDLRLLAILICACAFALSLLAYLQRRLLAWRLTRCVLVCAAVGLAMVVVSILEPGFDGKTMLSLLTAAIAGLVVSLWAVGKRKPGAVQVTALIVVMGIAMIVLGAQFLDLALYLFAGALLGWLFYRQALAIADERRERRSEEKRAERLEYALASAKAASEPGRIELTSAGRTDFLSTEQIIRFEGAGDYVEAVFCDGSTKLYDDALVRLEAELPADYIRVHRSHIVNTAYVRTLEREGSGTGRLTLTDGSVVPVSRRIMPSIKEALTAEA